MALVPAPSQAGAQRRLLRARSPITSPWARCTFLSDNDTEVRCQVSTDWAEREEERRARRPIFNKMVHVLKEYGATFDGSTKSWRLRQAVDARSVIQGMQDLGFIFGLQDMNAFNAFLRADNGVLDQPLPEHARQSQEPSLSQQMALVPVPEPSQQMALVPVTAPSQAGTAQKRILKARSPSTSPWARCTFLSDTDTEVRCQVSTDWAEREEERRARRFIFDKMVHVLKGYGATFDGSTKSWRLRQAVDARSVIQGMQDLGFIFGLQDMNAFNAFLRADNGVLDQPLPEHVRQSQEPSLSQQMALVPVPEPSQQMALVPVTAPSQAGTAQKRILKARSPSTSPWARCTFLSDTDTEVRCQVSTDWAEREEERRARRFIFDKMVHVLKEYGAAFDGSTKSWRLRQAVDARSVIQGMQDLGFSFGLQELNGFLDPLLEDVRQSQEPFLSQQMALVPAPEPSQQMALLPVPEPSQQMALVPDSEPSQQMALVPVPEPSQAEAVEHVEREEERVDRRPKREFQDGACCMW